MQSTVVVAFSEGYRDFGRLISTIEDSSMVIKQMRMLQITEEVSLELSRLLGISVGKISLGPSFVLELSGFNVVTDTHLLLGLVPSTHSLPRFPYVFSPSSLDSSQVLLKYLFSGGYPYSTSFSNSSLVVIKPHIFKSKKLGNVLDYLLNITEELKYSIVAMRMLRLSSQEAVDYLQPFRTVVDEYERWHEELSSGMCVALQIFGDENVVENIRRIIGMYDPCVARVLRPASLRALYGEDSVKNAVHITEISLDGPLECKFFFHVLK